MSAPKNSSFFDSCTYNQLCHEVHSNLSGLSHIEANERLKRYGPNTVSSEKKKHVVIEYLSTYKNPLIIILLFVAIVSIALGNTVDGVLVLLMILVSTTVNFFQEHRAGIAADALKEKVAHNSQVLREGRYISIVSKNLVPGDVIQLNAGNLIPADAKILESNHLYVNQSSLTGESFPVKKYSHHSGHSEKDLSDMNSLLFAGTSVTTGTATAMVYATGKHTEIGQLASSLNEPDTENEFTKGIQRFSFLVLRIILLFVICIFFANAFIKQDILQSLTFAIAVAVGLTPEFLPMIMIVTMSKGSQKMAKNGVIVKKLNVIPVLGSMDILCTDKTGTLTEDHISLVRYIDGFGKVSEQVLRYAFINSTLQTGITNPLDKAVAEYKHIPISSYKKIDEIPFDFERKRISVVVDHNKKLEMITKGAPEDIIPLCSHMFNEPKKLQTAMKNKLMKHYHQLSADGFRVLAIASKEVKAQKKDFSKHDEDDLLFQGFIAFLDPAKRGVRESLIELAHMGIEVKIVTGDNELVTQKICSDLEIPVAGIVLGHELHTFTNEQLYKKALHTTVFARCSPVQKERIIQVLRQNGRVVGYIGDGINDSPSLKAADVGISVSNGVDIAKETASIILTHKSLHELIHGVKEGRKTFGNTMKYIMMSLSSNFGNMVSVLIGSLFLPFLPMLPIQILLNNFLYDFGQVSIATDSVDNEYTKKPKRWDMKFIKHTMLVFGPISSLFDILTFLLLYSLFKQSPSLFQTGWFLESLATQTLVIHIIRTKKIPFLQSRASLLLIATTFLSVFIGWIIPLTPLGAYFGFQQPSFGVYVVLICISLMYLMSAEIGKRIFYSITEK